MEITQRFADLYSHHKGKSGKAVPTFRPSPTPSEAAADTQSTMSAGSMVSYGGTLREYVQKHDNDMTSMFENYPGVDRSEFDYVTERRNVFTTNLIESTAHLIKGCLGAGILAMPEAYMNGGLWTSFGISIFVGLIALYNMLILGKSAQIMYTRVRIAKMTYADLVEVTIATGPISCIRRLSKPTRYVLDGVLFFQLCLTCSIYQIMMAKTCKEVLEFLFEAIENAQYQVRSYVLFLTLPLLLICSIRSLKYLAPFSILGDIFLVICVVISMSYSLLESEDISKRWSWKSIEGMFKFLGVFLFSIDGFCVSLSVENNMTKPVLFPSVVCFGMSIVLTCVTFVGFIGYWGWGEKCRSPFLVNMPDEIVPIILQLLLTVTLGITFAVHFWVPFRIAWRYVYRKITRKRGWWERLFRCILILLVTCVTLTIPNITTVISFMGNVILSVFMFIFPPFIESLVIWRERHKRHRRFKLFCNTLSSFMGFCIVCGGLFNLKTPFTYSDEE